MPLTKEQFLADMEYRGIQDFLIKMEYGFDVPKCFVRLAISAVYDAYDIELAEVAVKNASYTGHFCLQPIEDEPMITLQNRKHAQ